MNKVQLSISVLGLTAAGILPDAMTRQVVADEVTATWALHAIGMMLFLRIFNTYFISIIPE